MNPTKQGLRGEVKRFVKSTIFISLGIEPCPFTSRDSDAHALIVQEELENTPSLTQVE